MVLETSRAYLTALEASGLLEPPQRAIARDLAGRSEDPRALAQTLVRREWLSRWQAEQLLAGRTRFFIGKYKLVSLIGRGGNSSVFLARHTMMNRPVALKLIARQLDSDPPALERFLGEVRAIASLDHPNIVHAYNVDCDDGRYFLVMEYVEGQDLKRRVEKQGPLDIDKAADTIRQAAEGLAHAHEKGIVHRDIKPANLLVNAQGVVKILDLGIAELTDPRAAQAPAAGDKDKADALVGTVDYMAPEQAMSQPDADHRVDLYSLGCSLYFLVTGRAPFGEGTLHERLVKHQSVDPPELSSLRPDAPRELADLCRRLMAKKPDDRPQSAREVADQLAQLQPRLHRVPKAVALSDSEMAELLAQDAAPSTPAPSEPPALQRLWRRLSTSQRRAVAVFAAICCLLAVVVAAAGLFHVGERGTTVAKNDPATSRPANPPRSDDELERFWHLNDDQNDPPKVDPSKADPAKTPPAKVEPSKPDAAKTPPGKAEPAKPEPGKTEPAKPEAGKTEPAKTPAKTEPAKSEPGKTEPGKMEPAKPEPGKTDPVKAPPAKPEPAKPEPAKPEPGKTDVAKPAADPWRDFPKAIDLPPLDASAPPVADASPALLRVPASPEAAWSITLLGGDGALGRAGRALKLVPAAGSASWSLQLETADGAEIPSGELARFARDKETLNFRWSNRGDKAGNALRNCLLKIAVAGQTRFVALRKPVLAQPVVFDLLKNGPALAVTTVDWLPDVSQLRLEVVRFEGRDGLAVVPPEPLSTKSSHATIAATRQDAGGRPMTAVEFRLSFPGRPRPRLEVDLKLLQPPPQSFKQFETPAFRPNADAQIKAINAALPAAKPEAKGQLQQRFDTLQALLWYDDFFKAVHRKCKMHYRVYLPVDDQQIDIVRTSPP